MSTAPAPTGALSPRGTYPPTGPQTQPFDTIRRQPGRTRPAPPHAGALAEAPGYPPLCAHGMNSLTDRGYDLALRRLRRG